MEAAREHRSHSTTTYRRHHTVESTCPRRNCSEDKIHIGHRDAGQHCRAQGTTSLRARGNSTADSRKQRTMLTDFSQPRRTRRETTAGSHTEPGGQPTTRPPHRGMVGRLDMDMEQSRALNGQVARARDGGKLATAKRAREPTLNPSKRRGNVPAYDHQARRRWVMVAKQGGRRRSSSHAVTQRQTPTSPWNGGRVRHGAVMALGHNQPRR